MTPCRRLGIAMWAAPRIAGGELVIERRDGSAKWFRRNLLNVRRFEVSNVPRSAPKRRRNRRGDEPVSQPTLSPSANGASLR